MAEPKPKDEQEQDEKTPFERFEQFVKKIAAVPKEEVDEKRREYERERDKKQAG